MSDLRPDISVVIVNYNAAGQLKRCLASIAAQTNGTSVETIVVDNASSDNSATMVSTFFPDVVLVESGENLGYTVANNEALRLARGEYVLFLNNDTEILEGAFERMLAYARASDDVGAVAPQLLNADLTPQGNVKSFPTAASALFGRKSPLTRMFPHNRYSRRYLVYLDHDMSAPFEADYASTACLMVRRDILETIGPFNTEFFCYWSDADLCQRIKNAGWQVVCEPAALVIHYEGNGGTGTVRRSWRSVVDFNRGAYLYYRKNRLHSAWSPMRLVALVGLSLNAVRALAWNRLRVFLATWPGTRLNPAQTPTADRAIRSLSSAAALLLIVVALLGAQPARAWLFRAGGHGVARDEEFLPYTVDATATADIEWLEAEAADDAAVARVLLPTGDAAPVRTDVIEPSTPPRPHSQPSMRPVRRIAPATRTYGMLANLLDPSDSLLDSKIALLRELGVTSVSMDFRWPLIEPEDDRWEFGRYDTALSRLDAAGIDVVPILAFTAPWASSAPSTATADQTINYPPSSLAEYEEFVTTVTSRYADQVTHWQLGIEPDLYLFWQPKPDPEAFVRQFKAGSAAVHAGDPSAQVLYPGLTTPGKLVFLEETLELGVADAVDVFTIHDYDNDPEGRLRADAAIFVSLVERYCPEPKACWCKEVGWSTYTRSATTTDDFIDGVTEAGQRDNLIKRWLVLRDTPLERAYTWELSDSGTDPHSLLLNFGITSSDLTPKKAFFAAKEVLPLVDGATEAANSLVSVEPASDSLEVHAFRSEDGALVVGLWDQSGADRRLSLSIASDDVTSPMQLDLNGGAASPVDFVPEVGGMRMPDVTIGDKPTVLVFSRPSFYTSENAFSPDGDGVRDTTRITFGTSAEETVTLRVLDESGVPVRTLIDSETVSPGSHEATWIGDDDSGSTVADGTYRVALLTPAGETENLVTVDTHAPNVTDVTSRFSFWLPEGDKRPYAFVPLTYTLSEPAHVTVDIFDADGDFYLQLDSSGMQPGGPNSLDWPVPSERHPDGWFWYRVTARDAAGNVVARESARPILVDFRGPVLEEVGFSPQTFSPNTDGIDDVSTLTYSISEQADVIAAVRDMRGERYYIYAVRGQQAGRYTYRWNGRAYDTRTKSLVGLPDGGYTLELTAYDPNGNTSYAWSSVVIADGDFAGPCVAGLTMTPSTLAVGPGGASELGWITFILDERADLMISAISSAGNEYAIAALPGLDPGEHAIPWDAMVTTPDSGRAYLPSDTYRLHVMSTDLGGNVGYAETWFTVTAPDSEPAPLENVSVTPTEISPNSDGIADIATISFDLLERADVVIFVTDADGTRYDFFAEEDMDPGTHAVEWRGTGYVRNAGTQVALPNGTYGLCVETVDSYGNVARYRGEVGLTGVSGLPLAVSDVSIEPIAPRYSAPNDRDRLLRIRYGLTQQADVVISLRSMSGRRYLVGAFAGQAPGAESFDWDGTAVDPATGHRSRVPDGTYVYVIEAVSGSSPPATASGRVSIDLRGPR